MLIGFAVVLLRYVLGLGSIWLQESILYAHAALFLLAAAWTLKEGAHVRVDVFYASATPRTKAWIDLLGALFLLLPFTLAILWFALPYVERSWAILERSRETSGLPLVFLFKTLIPVFALMLALQGVAQAIRALALLSILRFGGGWPHSGPGGGMPLPELLAILMVVAVCGLLMAGYPVALTLGGVSLAFAVLGHVLGAMDLGLLYALPQRIFGVMTNTVLLAIPLFIFMGVMLERSRSPRTCSKRWGGCSARCRGAWAFRSCWSACCLPPPRAWSARPSSPSR